MTKCKCGRDKVKIISYIGDKREEKIECSWCSMSEKSKKEYKNISEEVHESLKPLYNLLGVNIKTESLYWMNNEVYVIHKKTKKRREIVGKTQKELNSIMFNDAINFGKEVRKKNG